MDDLGEEDGVAAIARKLRIKQDIEEAELAALLRDKSMRRFIWTLLCVCGTNRISFRGEDTHDTAFNEGGRNIGNKLIAMIDKATPHMYMAIYTEFNHITAAEEEEDNHGGE